MKSLVIIILIQVFVAIPFLKVFGGGTDVSTYLYYTKYLGSD